MLISTSGPVKMNFTPDTYFNGEYNSFLLGKMEDPGITHESCTFPLMLFRSLILSHLKNETPQPKSM